MAADSDGCDLTTVVTCEGDLSDPRFAERFEAVVGQLNGILGEEVKVRKLEPWNSVRVTLSIPREAALRLRKLASEGAAQLRALGILSVQVEGDQVISLRIASAVNAEPQEIRLTTAQDGSGSSQEAALSRLLAPPPEKVQFKSPNVVCPADSVVPKAATGGAPPPKTSFVVPFPFTSMNQAIHATPPPPYPGKSPAPPPPQHPAVTISSPLLVNLLQNDGKEAPSAAKARTLAQKPRTVANRVPVQNTKPPQASTSSPSALSSTSIRQNSRPNSTNGACAPTPPPPPAPPLPPPPPYSVAVTRQWDAAAQSAPFLDLTPSLTDLKAADLERLLPTLERELARSPPEIPEELTRPHDKRNFLINPLTGELEPQSSGESDGGEESGDVFTGLPSPAALSDDDTNSTIRPDTTTDQSDSETRSSHSDSGKCERNVGRTRKKVERNDATAGDFVSERKRDALIEGGSSCGADETTRFDDRWEDVACKHSRKSKTARDRGRDSPSLKPATEKIKLRLKLEKSEPINSAYKVDVSFIQQPKKASASTSAPPPAAPGEELRVPPLHISLRGRHHAFITNKKKKLNPDKPKMRKAQDAAGKAKKGATAEGNGAMADGDDDKKKKFKVNHEHDSSELLAKLAMHNSTHYKEKQKERRGSDSELSRANMKFVDSNGIISVEKKRRLSQSETGMEVVEPPILGSTNVGTIAGLPQKPRKDKSKLKDVFKSKDMMRSKSFTKSCLGEKFTKQVALPTGEIDMEAKFKQRLMEGTEKGIPRPPHRTEVVHQSIVTESNQIEKSDQVMKVESEPLPLTEKSPSPDKCNTPERKQLPPDPLGDKQSGRSPNSGAQGEDSGIESMDALSEKSPNQASQSPHADIPEPPPAMAAAVTAGAATDADGKSKTQVPEMPDMLDIEAQLAKMEGLNGVEDVNENRSGGGGGGGTPKKQMAQCCELTSALQDSLKQGAVSLSTVTAAGAMGGKEQMQPADVTMVPIKSKTKDEDHEPLPVRVTPPLYTYSNPEKSRAGSESPTLSDDDSNYCSNPGPHNAASTATITGGGKTKSLLEQLLIEIPDAQAPSSPSPATRSSVRTRALSKLGSPELGSPVSAPPPVAAKTARATATTPPATAAKRKRHESDSSNNSVDEARNKKTRKCSENAAELIKACMGVDAAKANSVKKAAAGKLQEESSDSDEPLIEKVRKTTAANSATTTTTAAAAAAGKKVKGLKGTVTTRRSVRTAPTPNTRSKGDKVAESEAIRRKTRSAVSEVDSKRKKEVK